MIGCGFFALNQLRAWHDLPGVQIVALCDSQPERLSAFAAHCPDADLYSDAQQMLDELQLDFVDIATPTAAHKPLVLMAAQAGVQVICQKPFAAPLDDALWLQHPGLAVTALEPFAVAVIDCAYEVEPAL